jgi:hypothetical protein
MLVMLHTYVIRVRSELIEFKLQASVQAAPPGAIRTQAYNVASLRRILVMQIYF